MMAEDLWEIRERKQISVTQLALRSGLKQDLIDEYEEGRPLTTTHRARLAKVLYVNEDDIKRQSAPRLKREKPPAPDRPKPTSAPEEQPARLVIELKPAPPARSGQIDFLKGLAQHLGVLPAQLEDEIGKPLGELSVPEAKHWIRTFQARVPPHLTALNETKPAGYRSKRAHLPEGVDAFEANYLLEAQQANARLAVKLFNGETIGGTLIGFGPYTLTLQTDPGGEITLSKLAIAYYRRERGAV